MPLPRFEVPVGVIDGTNCVFTLSMGYRAGSTAVFSNGMLLEKSLDDGWYETDALNGVITMKEAPRPASGVDVLQVFYLDSSPFLPEQEISARIVGVIQEVEYLAS